MDQRIGGMSRLGRRDFLMATAGAVALGGQHAAAQGNAPWAMTPKSKVEIKGAL